MSTERTRQHRGRHVSATTQHGYVEFPGGPALQVQPSVGVSTYNVGPNRGRWYLDFTLDLYRRARYWHFNLRFHRRRQEWRS